MINTAKEPTQTDLRVFAFGLPVLGAFFVFVAGIVWLGYPLMGLGAVAIGLLFAAPDALRRLYRGWLMLFAPLAWLVSTIVLALVYYVVLTPVSGLKRAVLGSPVSLEADPDATTYWIEKPPADGSAHYFRQY